MEIQLHRNLALILKQKNISVRELSKWSGVPIKTIYGWLEDCRLPRDLIKLKKICNYLEVSLDEILFSDSPNFGQKFYIKGSRIELVFTS